MDAVLGGLREFIGDSEWLAIAARKVCC